MTDEARIDPRFDDPSNHADGYPPDWGARRKRTYRRDDYTCRNCGRASGPHAQDGDGVRLHAHHVVPKSKGGSNRLDNLTTLCEYCHDLAHDHDVRASMAGARTSPSGTATGSNRGDADADVDGTATAALLLTYPLYMAGSLSIVRWAGGHPQGLLPFPAGVAVTLVYVLAFLSAPKRATWVGLLWTVGVLALYVVFHRSMLASPTTLGAVAAWGGLPAAVLAVRTAVRRVRS